MERKQMKKLRQTKGESITEALVSIVLIALIFSFLAEAVVVSARTNTRLDAEDVDFRRGDVETDAVQEIQVRFGDGGDHRSATRYMTKNGYYYYVDRAEGD